MTGTEIITKFELQVDDLTELSQTEELNILNRVYRAVLARHNWSFLRSIASATISGGEIALPADFDELLPNYTYYGTSEGQEGIYVFVGTNRVPYRVIPQADRNRYRNSEGYCYVDYKNNKIVFLKAPSETTAEFDYKYVPDDITTSTSPVIPSRFQELLVYGMAVEDFVLQMSPKAKSYAPENESKFEEWYRLLANWDLKQL